MAWDREGLSFWLEFWQHHRGKLVGTALGLLFGLAVIIYGFFAGLFLALCTLVGYWIGRRMDEDQDILGMIQRFFHPRDHRQRDDWK